MFALSDLVFAEVVDEARVPESSGPFLLSKPVAHYAMEVVTDRYLHN